MPDGYPYWKVAIIFVLIVIEAVISAGYAALNTVNENQVRKRAEESKGDKRSLQILALLLEPNRYISLFEVLLTGTSIMIGILFSTSMYEELDQYVEGLFGIQEGAIINGIVIIVVLAVLLYVTIFFGNILPRRLAMVNPEASAYAFVRVMNGLLFCFRPVLFIFNLSTKAFMFIFRLPQKEAGDNVTEDEIISIVNEGHEQGILEDSEAEMISNIIEFDEKEVMDVMTHRKKIISVDANMDIESAMHYLLERKFSRFPVYDEDSENIVGTIHVKDLTRYYLSEKKDLVSVREIASPPYMVPDTQSINVLLNDMRAKKVHMAIAVDEYGQIAGLVTMEDILEEIVGNILDEHDVEEKMIVRHGEGRYLMKGLTPLEEVEDVLGISFEQDEYDTVNGFLISMLGHIPSDNEKVVLNYEGYRFYIVDVENKMIRYVRVVKDNPTE
ncbi:hemolysin family protein [Anaeromicropila populeti]|uniref:Putative hemolysin n=1 Tax=Anaeromicropila populeti TaxID=37658 RepID=A0A1I6J8I8_9FIRM|nr:hemolysin family protein [Anaeromicropila populeti]SFR75297.1 putative hemolysin [Anaeromicropila populeti]